jgi:hypothetical protein
MTIPQDFLRELQLQFGNLGLAAQPTTSTPTRARLAHRKANTAGGDSGVCSKSDRSLRAGVDAPEADDLAVVGKRCSQATSLSAVASG